MGFLIAAAQSASSEDLRHALRGVRLIGSIRKSGPWWWSVAFYLHFKELHEALNSSEVCSLSAYAGDGAWKLSLYGLNQPDFALWFDPALTTERGIEKAKAQYEGKTSKLAQQFGLSTEDRKLFQDLTFEEAVSRLLELQTEAILNAFQRFSVPHDPVAIRQTLLNPTADELESELGNLPRFLEEIGIKGLMG